MSVIRYHNDPDETEGRQLYRGRAEAEAARSIAMTRRVRLLPAELKELAPPPPNT